MADRCILYYITDRRTFGEDGSGRQTFFAKIVEAARAGVDYIQLREKDLDTRDLEKLAREVVALVREIPASTRILINSRTDVALAAGADGVHLRAQDVSSQEVKTIWKASGIKTDGPEKIPIVGVSCHSREDLVRAASQGADFAVLAPIFQKSGTSDVRPMGLDVLRTFHGVGIPVLALGGTTLENAASCLDAGAAGVAGIRLFQENKISDVVRALRRER